MPFTKGQTGGPGRPKKVVEQLDRAILLELYDEAAERLVILNMITTASMPGKQSVSAATWLDERKHGKVTEKVEQSGGLTIKVEYADSDYQAP